MDDISVILQALAGEESKRRESAIRKLTPEMLQDPRVIVALKTILDTDPQEYARVAAHNALVKAGAIADAPYVAPAYIPSSAGNAAGQPYVPVVVHAEPQKEGVGLIALGVGCVALLVCVPVFVIGALAVMGPQIGNIFSRVTSGLGAP